MNKQFSHSRPGVTFIELLLFLALLGVAGGAILQMFLETADSQVRQKAITDVEQTGIQLLQILRHDIQDTERILDPALGETGSVLTLQSDIDDTNPTIIATQSGDLLLIQKTSEYYVNPPEVLVSNFVVTNTSADAEHQSVHIFLELYQESRIQHLPDYSKGFETTVTLFPDNQTEGGSCGCPLPRCQNGYYEWPVCEDAVCSYASGSILCTE